MGQNQREPPDSVRGQLLEIEVLDHEDPMGDVEDLRDPKRPLGILRWDRAVAPGVTAGKSYAALSQPLCQFAPRSWLAGQVERRVVPMAPPAGVEQHRVTGLGVD